MVQEARAGVSRSVSSQDMALVSPRTSLVVPPLTAAGGGTSSAAAPTPQELPDVWRMPAHALPPPQPPAESTFALSWGRFDVVLAVMEE